MKKDEQLNQDQEKFVAGIYMYVNRSQREQLSKMIDQNSDEDWEWLANKVRGYYASERTENVWTEIHKLRKENPRKRVSTKGLKL